MRVRQRADVRHVQNPLGRLAASRCPATKTAEQKMARTWGHSVSACH